MFPSPTRILPALCALGATAYILAPAEARAQDRHVITPGLSLAFTFGDKFNFGLGADVRYTYLFGGVNGCSPGPVGGIGAFAQGHWLNFSASGRFAAGAHGGLADSSKVLGADAEVGWTYRGSLGPNHPGGQGAHFGLNLTGLAYFDLSFRTTIPFFDGPKKPEYTVAIGAHYPGIFGPFNICSIAGRPLRGPDGILLPHVKTIGSRQARHDLRTDPSTRQALALAFQNDARSECASIPAFLALARDLEAVGAPRDLVASAFEAAHDEIRHTQLCASLAGDLSGKSIAIELLPPAPPSGLDRTAELSRLAVESLEDGLFSEGAAALRARRQHNASMDSMSRATLGLIARDEARHADLGLRVAAYCLAAGKKPVRAALEEALNRALTSPRDSEHLAQQSDIDPRAWRNFGGLTPSAADAAWEENAEKARKSIETMLTKNQAAA